MKRKGVEVTIPHFEGTLLVDYDYYAGCPERGPTYACGGTPKEDPEVSTEAVRLADPKPCLMEILSDEALKAIEDVILETEERDRREGDE